jgi:hypothetical protein
MTFASVAVAEDKYVTPVQEQERFETATRLPEMNEACRMHMNYLRKGDEFVDSLLKSSDSCKKQIGSIMDKVIQENADACMASFDPTIRRVMKRSLNETFQVQGLQCTEREALLAPCPECNDTIMSVGPVITTMSTTELDRSLGSYIDFDVTEVINGKRKPKTSRLEVLARQYGCRDFDLDRAVSTIISYENEIVSGAQIQVKAYVKGPLRRPPEIRQEPIPGPRYLGKSRTELDPVRIAGDGNANRSSAQKDSSAPQAVSVTDLGNGSKAYVYQDPEHKDQSLVGVDIVVDPKTGAKKTIAFPVSAEDAAKIASAKDPTTCLDLITRAQETAMNHGYTPADALKNGEKLNQKLAAQTAAQEKAKLANANSKSNSSSNGANDPSGANGSVDPNANATSQADGKNVAQADSAPAAGKASSGVPVIDKSTVHRSGASASDAGSSDGNNAPSSTATGSTSATTPGSTPNSATNANGENENAISPEYRVGSGIGPSNGVKIFGVGTGTGLKMGGGVGLRGTQIAQSPSQAPSQARQQDPSASQSGKSDQSAAQATAGSDPSSHPSSSNEADPDHSADPDRELVHSLANRSSASEPNGEMDKYNRANAQPGSKTSLKTGTKAESKGDSNPARHPGQELVTNLSSRTSNSEPNGVPGYDVDSSPSGAKEQASSHGSGQGSGQSSGKKAGKPAVRKNSKAAAKTQTSQAKSKASDKKLTQNVAKTPAEKSAAKKTEVKKEATPASKNNSGQQASNQQNSKNTAKSKAAAHSGFTFTSENYGRVRYFLINKPPYKPYVGRVVEINGKTQVMMYDTGADAAKIKSMSHDPKQLKAEFLKQNTDFPRGTSIDNLAPGISNYELEDVLYNQVLKR